MSNFKKGFINYGLNNGFIKPIKIDASKIVQGDKEELKKITSIKVDYPRSYKNAVNKLKKKG